MSITTVAMEIITTQKGGEALIWQGCKFTLSRKMVYGKKCKFTLSRKMIYGKKYWRCAKRICPARIQQREMKCYSKPMVTIIQWMG